MSRSKETGPTFLSVLRSQGLRQAINFKAERICVKELTKAHKDAKKKGYNLIAPDYQIPWWFSLVSKLEWLTRSKIKPR